MERARTRGESGERRSGERERRDKKRGERRDESEGGGEGVEYEENEWRRGCWIRGERAEERVEDPRKEGGGGSGGYEDVRWRRE